jgi:hypothetical protein
MVRIALFNFVFSNFFTQGSTYGIHSQELATTTSANVTAQKRPNRAGATPLFCGRSAQKFRGVTPALAGTSRRRLRGYMNRFEDLSDGMSDILYEHERRSPLSILKAPPKQPKTVTVQARVEESVKTQLELYAEFIDASPSYVITEALKLLFRKDEEFKYWLGQHTNNHNPEQIQGDVLTKIA